MIDPSVSEPEPGFKLCAFVMLMGFGTGVLAAERWDVRQISGVPKTKDCGILQSESSERRPPLEVNGGYYTQNREKQPISHLENNGFLYSDQLGWAK